MADVATMNADLGVSAGLLQAIGREYGGTKKSFFDFNEMVKGGLAKQINQYNQMKGTVQATTKAIDTMAHPMKAVGKVIAGTRYGKMLSEMDDFKAKTQLIANTETDRAKAIKEIGKLSDLHSESMAANKAEMTGSIMGMIQYNMAQKKMGLDEQISLMDVLGAKWQKFKNLVIFVIGPILALIGFIALLALAFQDGTGPMADFMDKHDGVRGVVESLKDALQALGFEVSENAGHSEEAAKQFDAVQVAGNLLLPTIIALGLAVMGVAWPIAIMVGLLVLGLALFNQLQDAGLSFGESAGVVGSLIGVALMAIGIAFGGVLGAVVAVVGIVVLLVGLFFFLREMGLSVGEAIAIVGLVGIPILLAILHIMFGLAASTLLWIGIILVVVFVVFLLIKVWSSGMSLWKKIVLTIVIVLVAVLFIVFLKFLMGVVASSLAAGTLWPILLIAGAFIAVVILLVLFFKFKSQILSGFVALGKGIVNVFIWIAKQALLLLTLPWRMLMKGLSHIPGLGFLSGVADGLKGIINDIPMLELGGELGAGQLSIVGEGGPEFFMPKTAGTVIPGGGMDFGGMSGMGASGVGDQVVEENKQYQKAHLTMLKEMGKDFRGMRKDIEKKLIGGPVRITNKINVMDIRGLSRVLNASMSDSLKKLGVSGRGD